MKDSPTLLSFSTHYAPGDLYGATAKTLTFILLRPIPFRLACLNPV